MKARDRAYLLSWWFLYYRPRMALRAVAVWLAGSPGGHDGDWPWECPRCRRSFIGVMCAMALVVLVAAFL